MFNVSIDVLSWLLTGLAIVYIVISIKWLKKHLKTVDKGVEKTKKDMRLFGNKKVLEKLN